MIQNNCKKNIRIILSKKKNVIRQKYYKKEICTQLDFGKINKNTKVKDYQVVMAILYRLKTGCQWRELPMKQFFNVSYSWQSVYYHFQKWSKNGNWERVWSSILKKYRHLLDLSSIQLDGTHTPAKRGGEAVAYQGRKKSKTTNILIVSDRQGIPIACSEPIAGNHNDAYEIEDNFNKMIRSVESAYISMKGLFLNADSGFDTSGFRKLCYRNDIFDNIDQNKRNGGVSQTEFTVFDDDLYKHRFVIERTNAWLDAFKAILIRFETRSLHWKGLLLLAFSVILLRKL
jgi:transposase